MLLLLGLAAPPSHSQTNWQRMPILTPEAKKAGIFPGGEGGQWPRGPVAVSPADPDFLLLPIDVGGLYRSLDGGAHWEVCMAGWDARGANGFAIDPRNAAHVLGMGGNSMPWEAAWGPSPHGVYLSTDKAASWHHVLAAPNAFFGVVAFDPALPTTPGNISARAPTIWRTALGCSEARTAARRGSRRPRWRSGHRAGTGRWAAALPDMFKVTASGTLYAAGAQGLFRSDDHGETFTTLRTDAVYGLSVTPDGAVYVSGAFGVQRSRDGGRRLSPRSPVRDWCGRTGGRSTRSRSAPPTRAA